MNVYYQLGECDEETKMFSYFGLVRELDIYDEVDQRVLLTLCAENHFYEHDGWKDSWPIEFILYDGEGENEVCRATVEIESEPSFDVIKQESKPKHPSNQE